MNTATAQSPATSKLIDVTSFVSDGVSAKIEFACGHTKSLWYSAANRVPKRPDSMCADCVLNDMGKHLKKA